MISSSPGKAWRTLVESQGLPSDSTRVLETLPGELDIKRHSLSILYILGQIMNASADYLEIIDCSLGIPGDRKEYGRACVGIDPTIKNHR